MVALIKAKYTLLRQELRNGLEYRRPRNPASRRAVHITTPGRPAYA
jgi:hypothetical protein